MTKENRRTYKKEKTVNSFPFKKIWHMLRLFVVVGVSFSVMGVMGFYGVQLSQQFLNRPIASITVKGEFSHVSQNQMANAARGMIGGSFIGENISRIKASLESMPWVDGVDLSRRWPDQLEVTVREQIPSARWGENGFVNVRGEIIFVEKDSGLIDFSTLVGEKQDAELIMQQYSVLANTFQPHNLSIRVLEKNRRGVWKLELSNGWGVIVGRGDMYKKIQRLTSLLESDTLDANMPIVSIDLRYTNGLAVRWMDDSVVDRSVVGNVFNEVEKPKISSVHHRVVGQRLVDEKQYARG
jgi:cell division protein FtsQ